MESIEPHEQSWKPLAAAAALVLVAVGGWLLFERWESTKLPARAVVLREDLRQATPPPDLRRTGTCSRDNICLETALARDPALEAAGRWLRDLEVKTFGPFCKKDVGPTEPCVLDGARNGVKVTVVTTPARAPGAPTTTLTVSVVVPS